MRKVLLVLAYLAMVAPCYGERVILYDPLEMREYIMSRTVDNVLVRALGGDTGPEGRKRFVRQIHRELVCLSGEDSGRITGPAVAAYVVGMETMACNAAVGELPPSIPNAVRRKFFVAGSLAEIRAVVEQHRTGEFWARAMGFMGYPWFPEPGTPEYAGRFAPLVESVFERHGGALSGKTLYEYILGVHARACGRKPLAASPWRRLPSAEKTKEYLDDMIRIMLGGGAWTPSPEFAAAFDQWLEQRLDQACYDTSKRREVLR